MRYKGKKGKLWKIVSQYIRKRDKNICFTCGKRSDGQGMHAGHFIPSSVAGSNNYLNWDERNIHAQCYACNVNRGGWGERYAEMMEHTYGKEVLAELRTRRFQVDPVKDWDLLIECYQLKLEQLDD